MSGLLRRIKRSRPADAGEPLPEGQAAAPEGGAAPRPKPPRPSAPRGAARLCHDAEPSRQPAEAPKLRSRPRHGDADPEPVLAATPGMPAGLEPERRPDARAAGRRGRLRRRLRYLRRARELMLRDLGGLLYEIHRTGGGNIDAHATV